MTTEVHNILRSFDSLPEADKRELASEIIRRSLRLDVPPLSDGELIAVAEDIFVEFDRNEAGDG